MVLSLGSRVAVGRCLLPVGVITSDCHETSIDRIELSPRRSPVDRWALPSVFDVLALLALGVFLLAFAETSSSVQSIRIQKSRNTSDKEFAKKKWKGAMEEKRGTLEATAESAAVSVGRSGKIRQKRAVSETKSEERCH